MGDYYMGCRPRRNSLLHTLSLEMRFGKTELSLVAGEALASRPGCKWIPLGWFAIVSKAVPDIWWRDVMTAPAVTGTAVHFPLEWAELPSPCGLMLRVCLSECVSKRKQAGILTRCTNYAAYSKMQAYKQLQQGGCLTTFLDYEYEFFIYFRLHSGQEGCSFYGATKWQTYAVCWWEFWSVLGNLSWEPEVKVLLMSGLVNDWCFFPLAWTSIYFLITLFTQWLCTS